MADRLRVLLGVTGSVAAYKAGYVVRGLREAGVEVRVAMTPAAQAFIAPLTLQALSGQSVHTELLDPRAEAGMGHIELARWAQRILVAPASADFMARLAHGLADELLATLCLATEAPIWLAPAMNQRMWLHPATQGNVELLRQRGVRLLGPAEGEQACGDEGPGRMLEPEALTMQFMGAKPERSSLRDCRVLVTAGPTHEPIDPVRFVGNRSSGKMGYALAQALAALGAVVRLVSGPTNLPAPSGVELVRVETALEMDGAVFERIDDCDLFVAAAAVADYRPETVVGTKIKKHRDALTLRLVKNPDILARVAALPHGPFTVGFAAETEQVEEQARAKLQAKGLDMIAANRVGGEQGGFERDENALTVLWADGRQEFPLADKGLLAQSVAELIAERYHAQITSQDSRSPVG